MSSTTVNDSSFFQAKRRRQAIAPRAATVPKGEVKVKDDSEFQRANPNLCNQLELRVEMVNVIGFSQYTSLPARMASIAILACQ